MKATRVLALLLCFVALVAGSRHLQQSNRKHGSLGDDDVYNTRPIIGIMAQPSSGTLNDYGPTMILADYVKWVESAGGRVVPIPYPISEKEAEYYFSKINGLLIPGGHQDLRNYSTFYNISSYFYDMAIKANQKGDYFPIWGTCQGFQTMLILSIDQPSILVSRDYYYKSVHLNMTAGAKRSRLFSKMPSQVYEIFASKPITQNLHHDGVDPQSLKQFPALDKFWNILSTNHNEKGEEFMSLMEARQFPFYGTQFHPERNQFEWDPLQTELRHDLSAIVAMQSLATFFVEETRRNVHAFANFEEESEALIYNYQPVRPKNYRWAETVYIFPEHKPQY